MRGVNHVGLSLKLVLAPRARYSECQKNNTIEILFIFPPASGSVNCSRPIAIAPSSTHHRALPCQHYRFVGKVLED